MEVFKVLMSEGQEGSVLYLGNYVEWVLENGMKALEPPRNLQKIAHTLI